MIIENEHGQELDYNVYDPMGLPVWPNWRQDLLGRFLEVHHDIRMPIYMKIFKRSHGGVVGMADDNMHSFISMFVVFV
jgi:hypothetical protein